MANCRFPDKYNGTWLSNTLIFEIKSVQFNDTDTYTFRYEKNDGRIRAFDVIVYGEFMVALW